MDIKKLIFYVLAGYVGVKVIEFIWELLKFFLLLIALGVLLVIFPYVKPFMMT